MTKQLFIGLVVLVVAIAFLFGGRITGMVVGGGGGDVGDFQKVTIDMVNWKYSPAVINVEKDKPVRIYLAKNVQGCFRDLIIPELNINKYLRTSSDYLEVTFPEGTYTFACSMYHGTGKIIAK